MQVVHRRGAGQQWEVRSGMPTGWQAQPGPALALGVVAMPALRVVAQLQVARPVVVVRLQLPRAPRSLLQVAPQQLPAAPSLLAGREARARG